MTSLAGSTALVTGASSGIGAATATLLARRGTRVLLTGRDEAALRRVADATGGNHLAADLGDDDAAARVAGWAGAVDVLVCNAGVGWAGPLVDMPTADLDRLVTVNVLAPLRLARAVLPGMVARRRGHLVLVSSIAGCMGVGEEAVYAATKAALRTFADSVRYEVAGSGVGVSVVVPGVVDTAFFDRRGTPYPRRRPRPVPPEEVARALVDAVERDRAEVFVPRWLRLPARLHGAVPGLVRTLQRHFG
ncbi:SDR family NAD(P)-dependent oxidoreductase [Gandjariella thermophila]|uniref:Oxidoreductase n=1 Tax=Gandjariella thermophila TaxID=1931992 RepID=A0A4D4J3X8_9PSEU|nr:SDR family NAD(P)-dependent oxidoreductase [Gandjariella thermophila]GDY28687.1 oxidoreductase [Gandjariella thermophila]